MYTLNRPPLMPYTPAQLLSGMPAGIGSATHKPRPARCIHPLLLESTKGNEEGGIGYIDMGAVKSMKGISFATKGSGLLFGTDAHIAYVEADPRVSQRIKMDQHKYSRMVLPGGEVVYVELETGIQVDRPPVHLKRVTMQKNKYGMNTFDLTKKNTTTWSGLEYSDINSFMNPLLQMLYTLPAIHYALKTHLSGTDVSLSDELGFLYVFFFVDLGMLFFDGVCIFAILFC